MELNVITLVTIWPSTNFIWNSLNLKSDQHLISPHSNSAELFMNHLILKSDQHLISPHSNSAELFMNPLIPKSD